MGFFNSLRVRITLAILGGVLYALLTYALTRSLNLSSSPATLAGFLVYLLCLGSRLLLLFSGIDSPTIDGEAKDLQKQSREEFFP